MADIDRIFQCLESGDIPCGLELSQQFIEEAEIDFMEQLTLNTATRFIASVLLHFRFAELEKKPWKGILNLNRIRGALRFILDFSRDRELISSTFAEVSSKCAYAGLYHDASEYMKKSISSTVSKELLLPRLNEAVYDSFHCAQVPDEKDFVSLHEDLTFGEVHGAFLNAQNAISQEIKQDPLEKTDEFLNIRYQLELKIDQILCDSPSDDIPYCIRYWNLKKRILSDEYQIDWHSPKELNPDIRFC